MAQTGGTVSYPLGLKLSVLNSSESATFSSDTNTLLTCAAIVHSGDLRTLMRFFVNVSTFYVIRTGVHFTLCFEITKFTKK